MTSNTKPPAYDPNVLLNTVMQYLGLKSDRQLARHVKLARKVIDNIRSGRTPVSATIALLLQQATGMSIEQLRFLMGDRRATFRLAVATSVADTARSMPPVHSMT